MTNSTMKRLYRVYAFIVYLVPMIILFILRSDKYLKKPTTAIGFFGFIVLAFVIFYFSKQLFNEGLKGKRFIVVSGLLTVFSVVTLYLAQELVYICVTSFIASVFSQLINEVADVYENYEYKIDPDTGIKHKNRDKAIPQKEAWREAYL